MGPNGEPQNKPVGFTYNPELGTIDISGLNMETSAKYRNIAVHPNVAFVVDDTIGEGASGMRFLEIRGRAEAVSSGGAHLGPGFGEAFIRLHADKVNSFGIE